MAAEPVAIPDAPLRVLVIDRHPDTADSTATLIRMWGHDARVAHDGAEALTIAGAYRPQVVLSSLGLPRLDGFAFARQLRAQPEFRDIALIAITGLATSEARERSQEAGFDLHLAKPVDPRTLQELLDVAWKDLALLQHAARLFAEQRRGEIGDLKVLIHQCKEQERNSRQLLNLPVYPKQPE